MKNRIRGFTLVELLVAIAIIGLMAALLLPALTRVREMGRRAKCGKLAGQLAVAQNTYAADRVQRGRPEAFLRGVERFTGSQFSGPSVALRTNASRAYVWMAKQGFVDNLAALACPSDPLVAVLDGEGRNLGPADMDLHGGGPLTEGAPVPAGSPWAAPGSPAATETGHTYFSYSMQAGNVCQFAMPGPRMHAKMPLFGDRNPWCDGVSAANGWADPMLAGPEGNSWNHNREGSTLAFADGHVGFLSSARELEIPLSPASGSVMGYDYLYDSFQPAAGLKTITASNGRCPPLDTNSGNRSPFYTAWLVD